MSEEKKDEKLLLHEGKVYRLIRADGFYGYGLHSLPTAVPLIRWEGKKIPISLMQTIAAFFEFGYKKNKGETQIRLYHNRESGEWKAQPRPQTEMGMTTKEADESDAPEVRDLKDEADRAVVGFTQYGTAHHHCTGKAFQSGTDHRDEETVNGFHFTLGGISTGKYSFHARACLGGHVFVVEDDKLMDWFEVPQEWSGLPKELKIAAIEYLLTTPNKEATYPPEWERFLIRKQYNQVGFHGGTHSYPKLPAGNGNGKPKFSNRTSRKDSSATKPDVFPVSGEFVRDLINLADSCNITLRAISCGMALQEVTTLATKHGYKYSEAMRAVDIIIARREEREWERMNEERDSHIESLHGI